MLTDGLQLQRSNAMAQWSCPACTLLVRESRDLVLHFCPLSVQNDAASSSCAACLKQPAALGNQRGRGRGSARGVRGGSRGGSSGRGGSGLGRGSARSKSGVDLCALCSECALPLNRQRRWGFEGRRRRNAGRFFQLRILFISCRGKCADSARQTKTRRRIGGKPNRKRAEPERAGRSRRRRASASQKAEIDSDSIEGWHCKRGYFLRRGLEFGSKMSAVEDRDRSKPANVDLRGVFVDTVRAAATLPRCG